MHQRNASLKILLSCREKDDDDNDDAVKGLQKDSADSECILIPSCGSLLHGISRTKLRTLKRRRDASAKAAWISRSFACG